MTQLAIRISVTVSRTEDLNDCGVTDIGKVDKYRTSMPLILFGDCLTGTLPIRLKQLESVISRAVESVH